MSPFYIVGMRVYFVLKVLHVSTKALFYDINGDG